MVRDVKRDIALYVKWNKKLKEIVTSEVFDSFKFKNREGR